MPPAAHNSFIASADVRHAPRKAVSGAPDFAACSVCSAVFVCAMRYTFSRSSGAVVVREMIPAMPPYVLISLLPRMRPPDLNIPQQSSLDAG
jgi:hypothetical protein